MPANGSILEGGCGNGFIVDCLMAAGYQAVGIDYAQQTVSHLNTIRSDMEIKYGDVRNLPFDGNQFDGYFSGGVIEHFWDGYEQIRDEMFRVLKPGGYLFITFPYMSPLRKWKVRRGKYHIQQSFTDEEVSAFYQYVLPKKEVFRQFNKIGFKIISSTPYDSIKGLKDEVPFAKNFLQKIYNGKYPLLKALLKRLCRNVSAHMLYCVMQKPNINEK